MTDTPPPVPPASGAVPPVPVPPAAAPPPPPVGSASQPAYPAYGQQPTYGPPRSNTLATVSMVLSLVGLVTGITAIVGAILGHVALGQIKRTGEAGRPFALTGIIVGWIITGFWVLGIIAYAVFVIWIISAYGMSGAGF